jgi:hypothetical protein
MLRPIRDHVFSQGTPKVPLLNFGWVNPIDLPLFQLFEPVELWAAGGTEVY